MTAAMASYHHFSVDDRPASFEPVEIRSNHEVSGRQWTRQEGIRGNRKFSPVAIKSVLLCILFLDAVCAKANREPLLGFFSENLGLDCEQPASMCRAHSHNDYHQSNPLSSALKHGLKSVEVDVFPRKGGLWVAHTVLGLDPRRTIESMYIQPLLGIFKPKDRCGTLQQDESGSVLPGGAFQIGRAFGLKRRRMPSVSRPLSAYPRGGSDLSDDKQAVRSSGVKVDNLSLLVDFKGDADQSASLLQVALTPLRPFLSKVDRHGVFHQGRLTVLISGNRPCAGSLQSSNGERFLFLDGRVRDVRTNADTHLVPMVSLPWRQVKLAKALGRGERYMKQLSEQAHAQGKLVRVWGAPNRECSWRQMVRGNIDLLSIDDHPKFARFVTSRPSS